MSDTEQIRVEILATAAEFRAELDSAIKKLAGPGGLKDAIKDIPNQVAVDVQLNDAAAHSKLGRLREAIATAKKEVAEGKQFGLDTSEAELKLELLKRKVGQVKRDAAERDLARTVGGGLFDSGGGGSGGVGTFIGGTGPIGGLGAAAAAGSPAILAGAGGLSAIAGSAGAGLLGAGALGVGGIGALLTGLGSIAVVAKPAVEAITKVQAAQEALAKAQADYGATSKQAQQAQVNLNAVIKEAGPGVTTVTSELGKLGASWGALSTTAAARQDFFKLLAEGLHVVAGLLPTIAQIAETSLKAIDQGLQPVFKGLESPEFKQALLAMGSAFAQLAPPLIEGFANIFHALMNVAIAAAPFVVSLAKGFAELTAGWVASTSNGSELSHIIGGLVGQFRSWWELTKALAGTLVAFFSAGASAGQGLVGSLAGILREWTKWMNTSAGQAALKSFFSESARLVRELFSALAPLVAAIVQLVVGLMPVFTRALQVLAPVIAIIAGGIKLLAGLMGDGRTMGNLLAAAIVALAAAFAAIKLGQFIGWLVEGIRLGGGLVAVIKGLWATMLDNPIGLVIGALGLIAGAFFTFDSGQEQTRTTVNQVNEALREQHEALERLRNLDLDAAQAHLNVAEAAQSVKDSEHTLAADRKASHPDHEQLARDELAVRAARLNLTRANRELTGQESKAKTVKEEAASADQKAQSTAAAHVKSAEHDITVTKEQIVEYSKVHKSHETNERDHKLLGEASERLVHQEAKLKEAQQLERKATEEAGKASDKVIPAFQRLELQIKQVWERGEGATKKGIAEINKLTLAELKILAPAAAAGANSTAATVIKGLQGAFAGGGYIGQPGERGHDEVPIVVGRGEAILHAGHQDIVNQALAYSGIPGGLEQVFSETGGLHYNFAGGGFAGGTGPMGAMVSMANQITAHHYPYLWGGGHNSSFTGPYDCSGAVSAVLHAGGLLGAPEVSTQFENYGLPGPGRVTLYANPDHVYMSLNGRFFGTSGSNPGGGAGWFAGGPRPGFVVRHIDPEGKAGSIGTLGSGAEVIGPIQLKGVAGAVGQVAGSAVNAARKSANALLAGLGGNVPGAGAGQAGGGNSNENLANQALGKTMMLAAGWPASEWPALQALWSQESGWDANSVNSSSGAYGIPQALGHGHPFNLGDARSQIAWGLNYIRGRYGSPSKAEAHERADNWYARGGYAGLRRFARGGFAGGGIARAQHAAGRAARVHGKPPKAHHPPVGKPGKAGKGHKISTTALADMPRDVLAAALQTQKFSKQAEAESTSYTRLLDSQRLVPTEALATLTDADVAYLDPGTGPGGQSLDANGNLTDSPKLHYQPGDQLVNTNGMITGRFFTEGQQITGGEFHAGINTRTHQIGELLASIVSEEGTLHQEQTLDTSTHAREVKAIAQKKERRERIHAFLAKNVARALKIKRQLEAITTGNLKANLATALSKQAIVTRRGELQAHVRELTGEHSAEVRHQAQLIPIDKDPSYAESLNSQLSGAKEALAVENQLASSSSAKGAVTKAREALLKNSLKGQLAHLTAENTTLGGKGTSAGTGGLYGVISKQMAALTADAPGWRADYNTADGTLYTLGRTTAELVAEQLALNGTTPIQVRNPASTTTTGGEQKNEQLLALVQQQLATTQQALAISQSQYAVFAGFQPLLAGRLVGTFATGVDRVPRTGPAIVHQGEVILPDPDGPYGNRAAAQVRGGDLEGKLEIILALDDRQLLKVVDARVNDRALRVVSDRSGQRSRLIAGVTAR